MNKPWLKANQKDIKNLIKNQTFLVENPRKGEPVTPCMDVYKEKFNLMEVLKYEDLELWLEEICIINNWL